MLSAAFVISPFNCHIKTTGNHGLATDKSLKIAKRVNRLSEEMNLVNRSLTSLAVISFRLSHVLRLGDRVDTCCGCTNAQCPIQTDANH